MVKKKKGERNVSIFQKTTAQPSKVLSHIHIHMYIYIYVYGEGIICPKSTPLTLGGRNAIYDQRIRDYKDPLGKEGKNANSE